MSAERRQVRGAAERALSLARTGGRVATVGLTAISAAGRIRQLAGTGPEGQRERALFLRDLCRRLVVLHGIEVQAEGPLPLGPALLASNHVSYLDPIVIASLLPCAPISKADVSSWPVVGGFARELGVLFVDRGDRRSGAHVLRCAAYALQSGVSVLNFPEGTTTRGEQVLPFRPGLFGTALRLGVPVVPVSVSYEPEDLAWVGEDTFVPHYLRVAAEARAIVRVRLGEPVPPDAFGSAADLAWSIHARVSDLLGGGRAAAIGV